MHFLLSMRYAAVLSAVLLLAACGGSDPQPPAITAQPASLTVAEGSTAQFSVEITGSTPLAYAWLDGADDSVVSGATSATLSFIAALSDDGRSFKARVSNDLGSVTSAPATLSVTERGYSAPADVVSGAAPRDLATVADSNGHIHVLSINGDAGNADVQAHLKLRSADSSQANALLPLTVLQPSATLTQPTTSLRVAANGTGHVMAVWHRNGIVGAALYTPGATASAAGSWRLLPTRVSSFGAESAMDTAVTAVGNGRFEFVWRERMNSGDPHDVKTRGYTIQVDQLDSAIATIEAASDETTAPQIAADSAGNMIAAWSYGEGGVVFNRRVVGSPWGTTTTLAEGAPGFRFELLKSNAAGRGLLLASNRDVGTFVVLDLQASNPMLAVGGYITHGSAPDAHVDPTGRIRLFGVSVDAFNGNSRLLEWRYQNGWTGAMPVSDLSGHDFNETGLGIRNPRVAGTDAAGNLLVAWEERTAADAGRGRVLMRRWLSAVDEWRAVTTVARDSDSDHREPSSAIAADGSATVVYRDITQATSGAVHLR